MKRTKRIFAIFMTLALAMSMMIASSVASFAADGTYTISIDTSKDKFTHTYKVYQIFTGTPGEGKELTNVQYGSSYPGGLTGAVPSDTLKAITDARAWAAANKANLGQPVATLNATTTSYDAVPGWYLVLDTAYENDGTNNDAYSAFMVKVVNDDTSFVPKKEAPSVDKQVKDNDDGVSTGDNNGWGETADHKIGETFQFKLTATIPANADLKAYDTYMVQFNDTMSEGVTFEKINSVKVNNTAVTDYTSSATAGQAGGSWTLTIADVKAIIGETFGDAPITIEVEYDAHLNTAAQVNKESGATENENTVSLTYSNNPDATGEGNTDTTPEDHVWVFTYGNTGTKVDANNQPLPGAGFELYAGSTTGTAKPSGSPISLYKVGNTYYVYDATKNDYPAGGSVVTEMVTTADGVFDIKGLDVGSFTLYEKTVPDGYVQAPNTTFNITATHSEAQGGETANVDLGSSVVSETITNNTGSTLPETGGIGTVIFYVLGSLLVVGCGIVLISKRRMESR